MSEHLKFDTDFLDKDTPQKGGNIDRKKTVSEDNVFKQNWKNILIIGGVILFFSWVIFSGDSSSTNSNSSSSLTANDTVTVGKYSCSSYNASKAKSLKPSDLISNQLDIEKQNLDRRSQAIKVSASSIDTDYVNEYSQASISAHNAKVNNHNTMLDTLKRDLQSFDTKTSQFNDQVDAYNNFLDKNCTKK